MAKGGSPMGGGGFGGQQQGGFGGQQQGGYGGGFGGMLGQSSGGFQPSRQNFNQMPQQQQNFGGFDGGYGMPQQQQNFGGFGGGYNMSQQYTDDGSGYGGGYGMPQQLQQFQQQARQYQQPMQRFQQPQRFQQQRQYQQPQRFQQQMPQTDMVSNAAMPQQGFGGYGPGVANYGGGAPQQDFGPSQAAAQNAALQNMGMRQSDGGMDAGMGEANRISAERNMAERAARANQPPASMQDLFNALRSQQSGISGSGSQQIAQQSQMPPAPNMNQTFPEDQRMQFMRMMQQTNFSGGRPYGRSEYTQRY